MQCQDEAIVVGEGRLRQAQFDRVSEGFSGIGLVIAARVCFCTFILVTSIYCLLAYIPFTYQWVIKFNLVWWVPYFVKFHPYIFWGMLAINIATLAPGIKHERTRGLAVGFILAHVAAGVLLTARPMLSGIGNDETSFIGSVVWLFPLLWLGTIDYVAKVGDIEWAAAADQGRQVLSAGLWTGLFVSILYAVASGIRFGLDTRSPWSAREQLIGTGLSATLHLIAFAILVALLELINSVAKRFRTGSKVEFVLCHFLVAGGAALILRKSVLPAIAFNNRLALLYSVAVGFSLAVFLMGINLSLHRQGQKVTEGLKIALVPVTLPGLSSRYGAFLWAGIALLFAWAVPAAVAMRDWDFLLQKLSAMVVWPISFAAFYRLASHNRVKRLSTVAIVVAALSLLVIYRQVDSFKLIDAGSAVDRYSAYDVSFRVLREISAASTDDSTVYEYLREYTNILPSTHVEPVEINLVEQLRKSELEKPNIFIFVIDSLRRDYLSPYNKSVSFTPRIEDFARESVVMENAFTRYGGTALSEPAIWAGAMLVHKQYVLPFYPMNSLQRLLDTDEYQSFISADPILKELLRPSQAVVELDQRQDTHNFDFCWSLRELQEKLDARRESHPIFVYTQPWNVHTHVIAVEGRSTVDGVEYPGFWAPYASRVKSMDACFGSFVEYLKSRGLYDNSIVILTSDHGDAVGEEGRWGHSYWIYPEILRIPLIVHLPPRLRKSLTWDAKSPAFSTDITPSLYYLLGHRPIVANELFGRPLFTQTEGERSQYERASYVVASSYGAAYGVVSGDGRSLFVADGVKDKDYFFDLTDDANGSFASFTKTRRTEQQQAIKDYIGAVNRFYNLNGKPETAGAFDSGWQGRDKDKR